MSSPRKSVRLLTLVVAMATLESHAQFEWGFGAGAFTHSFSASSNASPIVPKVSNNSGLRPLIAVTYRERSTHSGNFFAEVSLLRSWFSTEIYSGGHYGSTKYLDVRLDHLYLTFGPEIGTANAGIRFGLQLGFLVDGRQEGKVSVPSLDTSSTWITIPPSSASDFTGGLSFLMAFHYSLPVRGPLGLCIDPFLSIPISSILKVEEPKLKAQQLGLRLGVFRKVPSGGVWKALRNAAPNRSTD